MFVVVVFLEARPEHRDKLCSAILVQARLTREQEDGCKRFDVHQDPVDTNAFLIYEGYVDQAAHRTHLELPRYAEYRLLTEPWVQTRRVLTYQLIERMTHP